MAFIGVLDSGVGGLSVLREIHQLLPGVPTLYFADQGNLPYGPRDPEDLRRLVTSISEYLISLSASVIVLACNSASAASLLAIRERYPHIPFVGMEPAVKPAVAQTETGVIAVLTTQATAGGVLYRRVLERYTRNVRVITQVSPGLVTLVEAGTQATPEGLAVVRSYVEPALIEGADQIVLACTHFPFVAEQIAQVAGDRAQVVDPSAAIARQVARVLPPDFVPSAAEHRYFTSGPLEPFIDMTRRLMAQDIPSEAFQALHHADGRITAAD